MNWRPPDRDDRQVAILWAVCAGVAVLLRPLWLAGVPLVPACPWHVMTGWPCPGCGTTRAIVHLLHADVPGAMRFNPLAASGAIGFVLGGVTAPVWIACGGKTPVVDTRARPAGVALAVLIVAANWAWLYASGV